MAGPAVEPIRKPELDSARLAVLPTGWGILAGFPDRFDVPGLPEAPSVLLGAYGLSYGLRGDRRTQARKVWKMKRELRYGFTLVELLVVIAIIGVLIALLLPAVQAAREAARRTQCTNHLKQIGLAVQMHENTRRQYPMGREATTQFAVSWGFRVLPFMEEQQVFGAFRTGVRVDDPANSIAMRSPVSTFYCPSRRGPVADRDFDNNDAPAQVTGVAAAGDYAGNPGKFLRYGMVDETLGPIAGMDGTVAGPIYSYSRITARRVKDGLSKTLGVGEKHIPPPAVDAPANQVHYLQGDTAFFAGDNPTAIFRGTDQGFAIGRDDPSRDKFGSAHSSLSHFVYLDGHVTSIDHGIEQPTFEAMSTIAGLEVVADGS